MTKPIALLVLTSALAACSGAAENSGSTSAPGARNPDLQVVRTDSIPPPIRRLAEAAAPGIVIDQAEQKEHRGDTIYWHVRGEGDEVDSVSVDIRDDGGTFDRLGRLTAIAVTRPIDWEKAPQPVRAAAARTTGSFTPERVNERRQLTDGTIVYELFPAGRSRGLDEPSMEVSIKDGQIRVVDKRRAI